MKLNKILNLLLISIPLVLSSECDNIDETLLKSVSKCTTNDEGRINGLEIVNNDLTESQINKLLSYDLTSLTYSVNFDSGHSSIPSHPGFEEIPSAIGNLKNLESLDISYDCSLHPCASDCALAGIIELGNNILKDLTNLKTLSLGGIKVSQDNINEISNLKNLESLEFHYSYLDESLNYESIGNLNKLNKLVVANIIDGYKTRSDDFYSNVVPESLVKSNKGIKELTMSFQPVSISKNDLPNLEKLDITWSGSKIDTSYIEQFDKLTDLEISFRGRGISEEYHYREINVDLSKLKNLKSLVLSSITVTKELMNEITTLSNLESLTLMSDRYSDDVVFDMKNLEKLTSLCISSNESKDMEDSIKYLTNLRKLTINYSISTIPEYIYTFKDLEYLDLSENSIKTIDEKIGDLVNLKHLDLSFNNIISIPAELSNLKKLEYLNLSSNDINSENPEFLNKFENLKYYYIHGNTNIKGKVLTNNNLLECVYSDTYNLCIPKSVKEVKCLSNDLKFEICDYDDINESTDGLCGKDNGKCPYGQCCGKDGKCGTTKEYCSIRNSCQVGYGSCTDECQEINQYLADNGIGKAGCSVDNNGYAIKIQLSRYNMGEYYQKAIDQLPNLLHLEKLEIDNYNYKTTDLSPLKNIKSLNDINIFSSDYCDGCSLTEIPEVILSLTNLKRLTIEYNEIKSIPDDIANLKNLEYLQLGDNELESVSSKISKLENLKEIDLSDNDIKKLPAEFGNLKNLEILNLSSCRYLTNYSDFIGNLKNLKTLYIIYSNLYSNLSEVPKEIGNLTNLENLYLYSNEIVEFPNEFENLKNLKILDISSNSLTKFPEFIGKLENLEKLDLDFNSIDDEIPKSYNNLSHLVEIKMEYNDAIRGETLTNESLQVCTYDDFYYGAEGTYYLCRHGNEKCLSNESIKYYKLCDNSVTTTPKTTTTTTKTTTTTTTTTTTKKTTTTTTTTTKRTRKTTTTTTTTTKRTRKTTTTTTTTKRTKKTTTTTTTTTTIKPTSTNGKCGEGYGNCPTGKCCSKYGWCGKTSDYCDIAKGCQSEFGQCNNTTTKKTTTTTTTTTTKKTTKKTKKTTTTATTTTKKTEPTVSTTGQCGNGYGKCPNGECCSKYGWCGKSNKHCAVDQGCQSEFGKCN